MKYLIHNNQLVLSNLPILTISSRAFKYGDGIFETIIFDGLKLKFWSDHIMRLENGMQKLEINWNHNFARQLYQNIISLIEENKHSAMVRVRLQVWRGEGGFYTPTNSNLEYSIETSEFSVEDTSSIAIDVCQNMQLSYNSISHLKTCNALPYIIACLEKTKKNIDDLIILDVNGKISEATSANIFWTDGLNWYTPSLHTGCIGGVARHNIIYQLRLLHINIYEVESQIYALEQAEAVILTNVAEIRAVKIFGDVAYNQEKVSKNLNFIINLLR